MADQKRTGIPPLGKESSYFATLRPEIVDLVPAGPHKVLEVGCGTGVTAEALKKTGRAVETVGIEIDAEAAALAAGRMDRVLTGNLEQMEIPYPENHFDYILCADILEHLVDPWAALRKLTKHLAPNGRLIASIPNIRHRRILKNLIFYGNWEYTRVGILDSTHLRFFTRKTAIQLFAAGGLEVEGIRIRYIKRGDKWLRDLSLGLLEDFLALQFILIGKKKP